MKRITHRNIFILAAIPILLVLLFCEFFLFNENSHEKEASRVSKVFVKKEKQLELLMDSVAFRLKANPEVLNDWSLLRYFTPEEKGLEMAVFAKTNLMFWSSSSFALPAEYSGIRKSNGLVHLRTGWYYQLSQPSEKYTICGFILIKREFPYHNRYIKSSFDQAFKLSDDYAVQPTLQTNGINIA